jgi:VWFA-related protein
VPLWNKLLHGCKPCFTVKAMISRVGAVAVFTLVLGVGLLRVAAQQPTFRAGTTLIELTLVATDQKGSPVTDLKADEIEIVQNGKPRSVEFFRFEGAAFASGALERPSEPLAPGIFTNRHEYTPGPTRNLTAIVLDSLNTVPEDQVSVRAQVMRYLRALAPNTRVAIYAMGGERLRILHDFTADLGALRERLSKLDLERNLQPVPADELVRLQEMEAEHLDQAVESDSDDDTDQEQRAGTERQQALVKGQMARQEEQFSEQLQMRRINQTVASLERLGNHLAGIPGRKSLIWISGGVPLMTQGARDRWMNDYEPQLRTLAQRLATQSIAIYPVQASGLQVGMLGTASVAEGASGGQASMKLRPMTREHDLRIWATMDLLADITGGRSFRNTNDLTAGVTTAANDMRGAYSLGFYVPDNSDNRWREFGVRVRRSGVKVLHRKGYMALAPIKQPANWTETDWRAAMQNPLGSTAIRLDARIDSAPAGLNILLQIAADDLYYTSVNGEPVTDLEIALGERDRKEWTRVRRDGALITIKDNPQQTVKPSIVRFSKTWSLLPETVGVRMIVRDRRSGRFGVLDMPLPNANLYR